MSDNLKDILSHLSTEVDQETLLKYLEGHLSEEQKHEVEKQMLGSDFTDDAMEGLQEIKNKEKMSNTTDHSARGIKRVADDQQKVTKCFCFGRLNFLYEFRSVDIFVE